MDITEKHYETLLGLDASWAVKKVDLNIEKLKVRIYRLCPKKAVFGMRATPENRTCSSWREKYCQQLDFLKYSLAHGLSWAKIERAPPCG